MTPGFLIVIVAAFVVLSVALTLVYTLEYEDKGTCGQIEYIRSETRRFPILKEPIITGTGNFKNVIYYCPLNPPATFQQMIAIDSESKGIIAASNSFLTDPYFVNTYDEAYENRYGMYKGLAKTYEHLKCQGTKEVVEYVKDRVIMVSNSFTGTNSGHDLGNLFASLLYIRENKLQEHTIGVQELGFKFPRILELLELFHKNIKTFDFETAYHCNSMDFVTVDPRFIITEYKKPNVVQLVQEIKEKAQFYMSSQGSKTPKNAKVILIKQKHNTSVRTHDSFSGATFLSKMNDAGWIVLNPEFDDMRYMICLLMHASHIIVSFGAIQWTHMLFFNPNAKITFFQVGGEVAYQPVAEMKHFSRVLINDTRLDNASNKNLFATLNPEEKILAK